MLTYPIFRFPNRNWNQHDQNTMAGMPEPDTQTVIVIGMKGDIAVTLVERGMTKDHGAKSLTSRIGALCKLHC